MTTQTALLAAVCALARAAGAAIEAIYGRADVAVQIKSDDSPLTEADLAAHRVVVAGLQALTPELPVLSEESAAVAFSERARWRRYWLVDPLDGTKEFIARNGEFSVNIALIDEHRPVLGVVYAPILGWLYFGGEGLGAWKQWQQQPATPIRTRALPQHQGKPYYTLVASRHSGHARLELLLERLENFELRNIGSALKMCLVAEGLADLYPRLGPTSEWDTAAAQAIVEAAGGCIVDASFKPLAYNTKDSLLNPDFYAWGSEIAALERAIGKPASA